MNMCFVLQTRKSCGLEGLNESTLMLIKRISDFFEFYVISRLCVQDDLGIEFEHEHASLWTPFIGVFRRLHLASQPRKAPVTVG